MLAKPVLDAAASATAREILLAEIAGLSGGEDLDRWSVSCLAAKNRLTAADARLVEDAFQAN